jgi:branched-chain amino acid aminotransferase
MNMARMNRSAARLCLPPFDGDQFLTCIKKLVATDKSWIPEGEGYSLYIRPTYISTHPYIGVAAAQSAKLYCILSPVGPYYPSGFAPIKLLADPSNVRAWPGGTGNTKIGGNYALSIKPGMEAIEEGFSQILWLFGDDLQVTEVGTMNQFFFWISPEGKRELVTAPLDGTILPGVTRDSILQLAREWGEFEVVERTYTLKEIMLAVEEKRIIEAFGAGTAAIVSPVNGFRYLEKDYDIPLDLDDPTAKAGPLTQRIMNILQGIQYGTIEHKWSITVDDDGN